MSKDIAHVVIIQLEGSPGIVFPLLDDALAEVKALLQTMLEDEATPTPIHLRTGTMSHKAIEELREFEGY